MNRRNFLAGAAIAVSAAPAMASIAVGKNDGIRMSTEEGDEGYRGYCLAIDDGKQVKAYLNGEYEKGAVTADERIGMVKRFVYPSNRFEEVYGDVRIVIS